jgi:hypothetical protein
MKIYTTHSAFHSVEANIIEPFKAGARNGPNTMVWHKEIFFPAHKDVFALSRIPISIVVLPYLFRYWSPRRKAGPVRHIGFLCCTPCVMPRKEAVFVANNFAFEKGRQCRMILCETFNYVSNLPLTFLSQACQSN